MNRVLHLALHDSRRFLVAKENFFFMFLMPAMFMVFFSVVLRGGDLERVSVSLQVVDADGGFLAEAFVQQLGEENFNVQVLSPAEADTTDYIRRVIIPAGFTDDVLLRRQVDLVLSKKSDSNIEFDAAADVRLRQVQASFLGSLILWEQAAPDSTQRAAGVAPEVGDAQKERLAALIGEAPRVTIDERMAGRGRPVPRGAGQSIPGMLAMFMVMITMIGGSENLTVEKRRGTLARLATTPFSRGEILGGKVLHLTLVAVVQALVLLAAGQLIGMVRLFGIEFSWGANFWLIILFSVPYAFAIAGLTLFFGGLFRTTQQAESLGWLVGMVLAALGGCWWPLEIMPQAAQVVGAFLPTYWAMTALHGVVTFGRGFEAIVLPSVILILYGLLFFWLGSRTMKVTG